MPCWPAVPLSSIKVTAYPATLVIDREGRLRYRQIGYGEEFAQTLEIAIDEPSR